MGIENKMLKKKKIFLVHMLSDVVFILLINVKMPTIVGVFVKTPTIVGVLTFMSVINSMFS